MRGSGVLIGALGALAVMACSGGSTSPDAAVPTGDSGSSNDGSSSDTNNTSLDAGSVTDLGVDGGVDPCVQLGTARCNQLSACNPIGLRALYGDLASCISATMTQCQTNPARTHTSGPTDTAACLAAATASCDSYFEEVAHSAPGCRFGAGSIADGATGCGYDVQCGVGEHCDLSTATFMDPRCMLGTCRPTVATGAACTQATDCDYPRGVTCVASASGTPIASDGMLVCQSITYGGAGAACVDGTNRSCQAAFYCGPSHTCVAKLGEGQPCNPALCDDRIDLECVVPSGTTTPVCTARTVVPSGAQCGIVNGVLHSCYGNAYCDTTTTPSTCHPRVAAGGGCVATIHFECASGLTCDQATGMCSPPAAPTCM
jgi:hypothetical protein